MNRFRIVAPTIAAYCKGATASRKTGSTIHVGAPAGTAAALAVQLNGKVPPLDQCSPPGGS